MLLVDKKQRMISVTEAQQIISENAIFYNKMKMLLPNAYGKVLARPIKAMVVTPPFDQSAMDGYAFSFDNWDKSSALEVVAEVQAGAWFNGVVGKNQAVRIFTGAALPEGLDTVVAQEKVQIVGCKIRITENDIAQGRNVRLKGSQTQVGEVILNNGHLLTPASISLLANVGVNEVLAYENPRIRILITGKELVKPGMPLGLGQIYESNSFALTAVLQQMGIEPVSVAYVDDDLSQTELAIKNGLDSDILIITGGVSVGDYDYVSTALNHCGVQQLFHKIKQKPGKPLYFGKHTQGLVFALPGNPAAVLTCFYEYVAEAIGIFTRKSYFEKRTFTLGNSYCKKSGLTHFVKGKIENEQVFILEGQESYLVNSFAIADGIVQLPEEKETFEKGEIVSVLMI